MKKVTPYIHVIRPGQWLKNFLVFSALFFGDKLFSTVEILKVCAAFFVFIAVSSAVYIVNDLADRADDKLHPVKKYRPIASGALSVQSAKVFLALLFCFIAGAFIIIPEIRASLPFFVAYVSLNILYSFWLKHIPVVELIIVSMFYLLRVLVGGVVISVPVSKWLILCVFFVTLLVVSAKRLSEKKHEHKRSVLSAYSEQFLGLIIGVFTSLTLICYSLYSVLGAHELNQNIVLFSVVFVLIAIVRFLMLALLGETEFPEKKIFSDTTIRYSLVAWLIFMYYVFYQ